MLGLTLGAARLGRVATAAVNTRSAPLRVAIYGDSFGQRGQDITGSPNGVDAAAVDPQTGRWPSDLTNRVGGVQWGFSPWLDALSGGMFTAPYQTNRAIGGFNTGQLSRLSASDPTPWYLADFRSFLLTQAATPLAPDCVILQAGTNDGVTAFSAATTYANILKICQQITGLGLPVFVATILPRGHAGSTAERLASDRITWCNDANALLIAGLAAEPSLAGRVRVIDPRASFRDLSGQANDILPAMVYDGLHLSVAGCRILARAYLAAMSAYFGVTMVGHLPTGASYVANGLMSGTGGTVTRSGNAASNAGFTISGTAPTGWTVTTTLNGGATAWNGTSPSNITGTVIVARQTAALGEAIVITADCVASGLTNANTRAIEAFCAVTLPSTTELPVGAWFRGLAVVELSAHKGCRGVSAELRLAEPDGTTRILRSCGPAPNGTANMTLDPAVGFFGADRLILQTPPRIRKAGSYGVIEFAILLYFAGQAAECDGVLTISQAGVVAAP